MTKRERCWRRRERDEADAEGKLCTQHWEGRATVGEDGRSEVGWRDKNRRAARKWPGAGPARWCPLKTEISAVRTGNLEGTPVSVYQVQGC